MEALRHHPQPFHYAQVPGFVWFCDVLCLYLMKNQTHQPHQPRFAGYECDVCQEDILDGKRFFDCRKCDFSMCLKCQAQRSR